MALRGQFVQPNPVLLTAYGEDLRQVLAHAQTVIPFHSTAALQGGIIDFLRTRFAPDNDLPWEWTAEAKTTGIIIESAYNEDTEVRGARPGVYVERLNTQESVIGLDKTIERGLRTGNALLITHDQSMFQVYTVSQKRGESALLGDIVYCAVQEGFKELQRAAWIRDIRNLRMDNTIPHRVDAKAWMTPITFQVEVEKSWFRAPRGVKLREILLSLESEGSGETREILVREEP